MSDDRMSTILRTPGCQERLNFNRKPTPFKSFNRCTILISILQNTTTEISIEIDSLFIYYPMNLVNILFLCMRMLLQSCKKSSGDASEFT